MTAVEAKALATGLIWLSIGLAYFRKKNIGDDGIALFAMLATIAVWSDGCGCGR